MTLQNRGEKQSIRLGNFSCSQCSQPGTYKPCPAQTPRHALLTDLLGYESVLRSRSQSALEAPGLGNAGQEVHSMIIAFAGYTTLLIYQPVKMCNNGGKNLVIS